MKIFKVIVIASTLSSVLLVADMSIDAQIKKIKQASPQERYKLVNQLKEQIARMNALQQARSISKYQEESLKAQHRAPVANQILFQEQLRQHEVDKSIVPPVKELPASKLKPTSIPAKIVPVPKPSYHDRPTYTKPEYKVPKPTYTKPKPEYHAPTPSYHDTPKPTYTKPEYKAPKPTYTKPEPEYKAPKPTYTKPKPEYHAPTPSYHDRPTYTKPEYKVPKPTYTKPKPEYHAPKPSYHDTPKPTYTKPSTPVKKTSPSSFSSHRGGF